MKKRWLVGIFVLLFLFSLQSIFAFSNESIQTKEVIDNAKSCINEMQEKEIPIERVNETYNDALQLYSAQLALEEKRRIADYDLVEEYSLEVCDIKKTAIEASDELQVFKETYEDAVQHANLSLMEEDYNKILKSFEEERFEETIELINEGYKTMSEIEASQTALRLFYLATTDTIKTFFIKNWKKLLIAFGILLVFAFMFWTTLLRLRIRFKIRSLFAQKEALNTLIKKLQRQYFDTKSLSEIEYRVKLERFKEMLRDIERQLPLLREEMIKLSKKEKKFIKKEKKLEKVVKKVAFKKINIKKNKITKQRKFKKIRKRRFK